MVKSRMLEVRWPRWTERQARFAPFGVPIATYLLIYFDEAEWVIWKVLDDLGAVSNMVSLGVAVYIVTMVAIDWSRKMALGGFTRARRQKVVQRIDSIASAVDDPDTSRDEIMEAVKAAKKEAEQPTRDNFVIRWLASWDD